MSIWVLLLAVWPQVGCLQLPNLGWMQGKTAAPPTQPLDKHLAMATPPQPTPTPAEIAQSLAAQADTQEQSGRTAEAVATLERLRQGGGEYALYATQRLASLHDRSNNVHQAEQEYELLLRHNKQQQVKDAELLYRVGDFYYRRGHWGTAQKYLSDATWHQPNHAQATFKLGLAHAQNGDYDESLKEFAKVLASKAEAYCNIAFVMNTQGKREDAARMYQTALGFEPTMARAQKELANMGDVTKTPSRGIAELEKGNLPLAQAALEGRDRLMSLHATLPPLPDVDFTASPVRTGTSAANKKSR